MAYKFLAIFAVITIVRAGFIPATHEISHLEQTKDTEHYDSHPHYQFAYAVHDAHTGDVKNQYEFRDGDTVQGEYSLVDADGHQRIVKYTADHKNGFNAVVERKPLTLHSSPVIKEDSIVHSIPTAIKSVPVTYSHSYYH